ncbi:hypothetical protein E4A47_10330 [Micrococcus flavus]|uniref:Endonuclease YncB(Thermonuclease family) n=1 Tax=Micrococcus flavus TaxID=384602 RepID=A0A4Y8WWK9_9MICC|nr:hypothetical protein [Micrococcus flavus]MBB4883964.1 endonuclease YncB(thermonuclease family) [Micrococcus flavus]TFH99374.1 hypothetical protein E4A47_10330 [Micrococcus flavus]GGK54304.1 hypothetical protein GCM10007073_21750 [Micrococcus flavus]
MSQDHRLNRAREIAKFAARNADETAKYNPAAVTFYAHAGDDTGRLAAEAFRAEGADAAAEVVAEYHRAYQAAAKTVTPPTWDKEIQTIGSALPPSITDEDGATEQIEEAMRRITP